jgi:hypothetical protein
LVAPAIEERIAADEEPAGSLSDDGREGRLDLVCGAGAHDDDLLPDAAGRRLRVSGVQFDRCIGRIHKKGDGCKGTMVRDPANLEQLSRPGQKLAEINGEVNEVSYTEIVE